MPCLMSTEEYARSYDRCAERLYRFALYVLGDARQAESAVAYAFASGLQARPPLKGDGAFLEEMLRLVCGACERAVPGGGLLRRWNPPGCRRRLRRIASADFVFQILSQTHRSDFKCPLRLRCSRFAPDSAC